MDKKNVKNFILLIIIVIAIGTIAIAFAYIGSKANINGSTHLEGEIILDTDYFELSYSGASEMALDLSYENLSISNKNNYISSSDTVEVSLSSDTEMYPNGITCEFYVYYIPEVTYNASNASETQGISEFVLSVNGKETNLNGISNKTQIYSSAIATDSSGEKSINLDYMMKFYNLDADQSDIAGQIPSGTVVVESGECGDNR